MLDTSLLWLLTPLSGAAEHHIASSISWHGRLMVLGWGVCMPLGVLAARYLKILPRQNWPEELDTKWWWHAHLTMQLSGVSLALLAIVVVWGHATGATVLASTHGYMGWFVSALAVIQVLSGVLRGSKGGPTDGSIPPEKRAVEGDHFLMTRRRLIFERVHKGLGWLALLSAAVVIIVGLVTADAPRWMFLGVLLWWACCAVLFVYWQVQGRCIDTYQAIWGPDAALPGNRIAPIGLGIRRLAASEWKSRFYRRPLWPMFGRSPK